MYPRPSWAARVLWTASSGYPADQILLRLVSGLDSGTVFYDGPPVPDGSELGVRFVDIEGKGLVSVGDIFVAVGIPPDQPLTLYILDTGRNVIGAGGCG